MGQGPKSIFGKNGLATGVRWLPLYDFPKVPSPQLVQKIRYAPLTILQPSLTMNEKVA